MTSIIINGLHYKPAEKGEDGHVDLQAIPLQLGKRWRGQDLVLEERVYDILETRAIIHRLFTSANGDAVFLSVVHYSDTKIDFHTPEACLGGRGLNTTKTTKTVTFLSGDKKITLDVAEVVATGRDGQTLSYYFYKSGDFVGSSYIKMRLNISVNKLLRNDAAGSMIRISTALLPGEKAKAEGLLTDFLKDFFPYVQQTL